MLNESDMKLDVSLTLLSLLLGESTVFTLGSIHFNCLKLMIARASVGVWISEAIVTEVKV
jgi:hypothetical protein